MQRAQAAVQLRQTFEDEISEDREADEELLAAFMRYIAFERAQAPTPAGPARLRVLLERAAARFPVTVDLWREIVAAAEASAVGAAAGAEPLAALRVCCARACRNCPWRGELWAARLRAVELAWDAEGRGAAAVDGVAGWEAHSQVYSAALSVRLLRHATSMPGCLCASLL